MEQLGCNRAARTRRRILSEEAATQLRPAFPWTCRASGRHLTIRSDGRCNRDISEIDPSFREKPMKPFVIAAAAIAGLAFNAAIAAPLPEAKPDDVGFSQQGLTRLDDFFAREIAAKRVPGAVVAIARDGKLVHYKAYGQLDPAKGTPMPLDAVFALASMTKPMAAVAGLTLMEQGRLPLQAKLSDYYPAFADMKVGVPQADGSLKLDAQATPIFIHDLYRHT